MDIKTRARPEGTCRFQADISSQDREWFSHECESTRFCRNEWLVAAIDEIAATADMNTAIRARTRQQRLDFDGSAGHDTLAVRSRFQIDLPARYAAWLRAERDETGFSYSEWLTSALGEIRATQGCLDRIRSRVVTG